MTIMTPTDPLHPLHWSAPGFVRTHPGPERHRDTADAPISQRLVLPAVIATSAVLWVALILAGRELLQLI